MAWENRNLFNKRFASKINKEDAYVTGYFYIKFEFQNSNMEQFLANYINDEYKDASDSVYDTPIVKADISRALSSTCIAVSAIPGGTMNKASIGAMGGTKWGAITNQDWSDVVTFRFIELSGVPMTKLISAWFNIIRDKNTGLSVLGTPDSVASNELYSKNVFSSSVLYWTTKPNGREIEFACKMDGCYPLKDPLDLHAFDLSAVDSLPMDIDFHVDSIWWDSTVENLAAIAYQQIVSNGYIDYYQHEHI